MTATSYVMKVSTNGQVSIPASTRARWRADRVVVVDLGDRVVMRPVPPDPIGSLRGKYAGRGGDVEEIRRQERRAELAHEQRRR